ncbi:hypothetical protein SprV_0301099300 [Sparganum proliferum]
MGRDLRVGVLSPYRCPVFDDSRPEQSSSFSDVVALSATAPDPYPTNFGAKARRCTFPCSFASKQSKRVKPLSTKVSAVNLPRRYSPGHTIYVFDNRNGRHFLVDAGTQSSAIPPTAANRRCPNPRLFLPTITTLSTTTLGTCSLCLDIGLRCLLLWVLFVDDFPSAISGADFPAAFELWLTAIGPVYTTRPPTSPSEVSLVLTVT